MVLAMAVQLNEVLSKTPIGIFCQGFNKSRGITPDTQCGFVCNVNSALQHPV